MYVSETKGILKGIQVTLIKTILFYTDHWAGIWIEDVQHEHIMYTMKMVKLLPM